MNAPVSSSPSERDITPALGVHYRYLTFKRLVNASRIELENILDQGMIPNLEDLVGWEFRGCNTAVFSHLLRIRKFKKGFHREPANKPHECFGYNIPTVQNATFDPHLALPNESHPKRFGFYLVTPDRTMGPDDIHHNALLLDYGSGPTNPLYDPSRLLRDYLVQVDPDNPDLFLGKAYLAFGPKRVFAGFFVLERYNKIGL